VYTHQPTTSHSLRYNVHILRWYVILKASFCFQSTVHIKSTLADVMLYHVKLHHIIRLTNGQNSHSIHHTFTLTNIHSNARLSSSKSFSSYSPPVKLSWQYSVQQTYYHKSYKNLGCLCRVYAFIYAAVACHITHSCLKIHSMIYKFLLWFQHVQFTVVQFITIQMQPLHCSIAAQATASHVQQQQQLHWQWAAVSSQSPRSKQSLKPRPTAVHRHLHLHVQTFLHH